MQQRPIVVTETSEVIGEKIEYNAVIEIAASDITLTLKPGAYTGCKLTIIATFAVRKADIVTHFIDSNPMSEKIEAGEIKKFIYDGHGWKEEVVSSESGGGGGSGGGGSGGGDTPEKPTPTYVIDCDEALEYFMTLGQSGVSSGGHDFSVVSFEKNVNDESGIYNYSGPGFCVDDEVIYSEDFEEMFPNGTLTIYGNGCSIGWTPESSDAIFISTYFMVEIFDLRVVAHGDCYAVFDCETDGSGFEPLLEGCEADLGNGKGFNYVSILNNCIAKDASSGTINAFIGFENCDKLNKCYVWTSERVGESEGSLVGFKYCNTLTNCSYSSFFNSANWNRIGALSCYHIIGGSLVDVKECSDIENSFIKNMDGCHDIRNCSLYGNITNCNNIKGGVASSEYGNQDVTFTNCKNLQYFNEDCFSTYSSVLYKNCSNLYRCAGAYSRNEPNIFSDCEKVLHCYIIRSGSNIVVPFSNSFVGATGQYPCAYTAEGGWNNPEPLMTN